MELQYRDPSTPLTIEQSEIRKMVYKQISGQPETFNMSTWFYVPQPFVVEMARVHGEACHTTRCVAGWAQFYAHGKSTLINVDQDAITAMGLTWDEYSYGCEFGLFYSPDRIALAAMKRLAEVAVDDG